MLTNQTPKVSTMVVNVLLPKQGPPFYKISGSPKAGFNQNSLWFKHHRSQHIYARVKTPIKDTFHVLTIPVNDTNFS